MSARAWAVAAVATAALEATVLVACGGTTGREGLSAPSADAGPADATVGPAIADAEAVDVAIAYADRVLPEAGVARDGAGGAGYPWPTCPPFLPVGPDGGVVPLGDELDQVPSAFDDGGNIVRAPDGSACATYGWLGGVAADACLTSTTSGGPGDYVLLPPCNWCSDAGVAVRGAGAGRSRNTLCLELYACIAKSGCAPDNLACLCGGDKAHCVEDAGGPCAKEELAALEEPASAVEDALKNYHDTDPSFVGRCGSLLNFTLQSATTNGCLAAAHDGGTP